MKNLHMWNWQNKKKQEKSQKTNNLKHNVYWHRNLNQQAMCKFWEWLLHLQMSLGKVWISFPLSYGLNSTANWALESYVAASSEGQFWIQSSREGNRKLLHLTQPVMAIHCWKEIYNEPDCLYPEETWYREKRNSKTNKF